MKRGARHRGELRGENLLRKKGRGGAGEERSEGQGERPRGGAGRGSRAAGPGRPGSEAGGQTVGGGVWETELQGARSASAPLRDLGARNPHPWQAQGTPGSYR